MRYRTVVVVVAEEGDDEETAGAVAGGSYITCSMISVVPPRNFFAEMSKVFGLSWDKETFFCHVPLLAITTSSAFTYSESAFSTVP